MEPPEACSAPGAPPRWPAQPSRGLGQGSDLIDQLFERSRDKDHWQPLCSVAGIDVSYTDMPYIAGCGAERSILLASSLVAREPLEHILAVLRPEALFSDGPSYHRSFVAEASLLHFLGAGDAIVLARYGGNFNAINWMLSPFRTLTKRRQEGLWCFRVVVQRDVPRTGDVSMVVVPVDPELHQLRETVGPNRARSIVLEAVEGGKSTRVTCIWRMLHRARWAAAYLAKYLPLRSLEAFAARHHQEAREQSGYIVVRIRKCLRGPPFLPVAWPVASSGEESWTPHEEAGEEFHLVTYLRRLLEVLGRPHVDVFSDLDGRRLVFYDAALRRTAWRQVSELLDLAFCKQRQAYRRMMGGTNAPVLQVDVEPRFLSLDGVRDARDPSSFASSVATFTSSLADQDEPPEEMSWVWSRLPVKNSFIDFPTDFQGCALFYTP